jgi:two-component system cell cycle sensor histidine kinase PleC
MTQTANKRGGQADNKREALARLQLIADGFTGTLFTNPGVAVVFALVLVAPGSPFGPVPIRNVILMLLVHGATAFGVWYLLLHRKAFHPEDLRGTERCLIGLQAALSAGWVVSAALCWLPGNDANNAFIALVMALITLAASFTRAAHVKVMLTAAGVLGVGMMVQLAFAPGEIARTLLIATPFFLVYAIALGWGARRHVNSMVQARLDADNLARALTAANNESLRKRYEAEAANASKTAFLANMSHELRTPLNAILGFSDVIANQSFGPDAARYADYARDIHNSGAHLLSLINDLLDVAKIESGKMEIDPMPLDPRPVVEDISRLLTAGLAARKQTLHIAIEPDVPPILADERAFRQMLLNLGANAIKFTQKGGEITFGCRRADDGGVIVSVRDNGPGIAPDKLARVFKPFSQIDNRYDREAGGTGLGLALVRGLAELHGGRVWLESALGEGVNACIYFPSTIESGAAVSVAKKA